MQHYFQYAVTPLTHSGRTPTTAPTPSRKSPSPAKLNEVSNSGKPSALTLKNLNVQSITNKMRNL